MAVDFQITDDGWITRLKFTDPWDVGDLLDKFAVGRELRDRSLHSIYTLIDLRDTRQIPPSLLRVRASPVFTHPRSGYIAVIGASTLAQALVEMIAHLSHKDQVGFFASEEQALSYLRRLINAESVQQ